MRRRAPSQRPARRGALAASLVALALAAGVVQPAPPRTPKRADLERAEAALGALARAFRAHHVDTGRWPDLAPGQERTRLVIELSGLEGLVAPPAPPAGWSGPYLEPGLLEAGGSRLLDPWGRPYLAFHLPGGPGGAAGTLRLYSAGPDGRLETGPDDAQAGRTRGDDLGTLVTRLP